jgi:hypothetical protein
MRIVVTGDRMWACDKLALAVLKRLIARYGREIFIVHGGSPGVDESFNQACKHLGISVEARLPNWGQTGPPTVGSRNRELLKAGADLCIALHQSIESSDLTRDCVRQAMQAGIQTFLIEDERAVPRRLK